MKVGIIVTFIICTALIWAFLYKTDNLPSSVVLPPPGPTSIEVDASGNWETWIPPASSESDKLKIRYGNGSEYKQFYYIDPNGKEWILKKIDPNECQHDSTICLHDGLDANGRMFGIHVKCLDCDKRL